jgi:hypothetical protein
VFAQVSALPNCGCVDSYKFLSFWKFIYFRRALVSGQPSPCDEERTHLKFSTWTVIERNDGDSWSGHSVLRGHNFSTCMLKWSSCAQPAATSVLRSCSSQRDTLCATCCSACQALFGGSCSYSVSEPICNPLQASN